MNTVLIEALGYLASFIILVSLTMKSIVKLRWINAFGSFLFVIFAVLTKSIPTVFMNCGIVVIDLWYVYRMTHIKTDYKMVPAERNSAFLAFFHDKYNAEIESIFGDTAFSSATGFSWFVVNNEIAGLFAWKEDSVTDCRILIDFVTERYRDTKIGQYFFESKRTDFLEKGFSNFIYLNVKKPHWNYLRKIGFTEDSIGCFSKRIKTNES